jgi:Effector Associated Constant Component 1
MTGDLIEVEIDPAGSRFEPGSGKWLREREDLRYELERSLGPGVVRPGSPQPGSKGPELIPIIVALGGAHAFQALSQCITAWLKNRGRESSVTITATIGDQKITVQADAKNASLDVLLQPVLKALGEAAKPK